MEVPEINIRISRVLIEYPFQAIRISQPWEVRAASKLGSKCPATCGFPANPATRSFSRDFRERSGSRSNNRQTGDKSARPTRIHFTLDNYEPIHLPACPIGEFMPWVLRGSARRLDNGATAAPDFLIVLFTALPARRMPEKTGGR